ncbi:hypothetical protein EON82_11905 [bacterium]|nr:MAG: hypothetical protein EON82_11905 [bacterium]
MPDENRLGPTAPAPTAVAPGQPPHVVWAVVPLGRAKCFFCGNTWDAVHKRASAIAASNQVRGEIRRHLIGPREGR